MDVRRLKGDLWRKIDAFAVTADRDADVVDVVDYDREEEKRMKNEDDGQQVVRGVMDAWVKWWPSMALISPLSCE